MANWASHKNVGDPLSPGWRQKNLKWIEPVKGQRWEVYAPAAAAFEGLINDLVKLGYSPTSSGGYNYRNKRGGDTLSQHAYGTAIDLNSMTNQQGQSATDIPQAAELARKWGLDWGGNWKSTPDPMHFEYQGQDVQELDAQMQAAGYTPEQRRNAIASIESAGSGDYGALGQARGEARDRAYGRYQIMGSNIAPWAEQYLKQSGITPAQFLKDPALQDKLFDAVYGDYVSKYGERGAASKWFTGSEKEPDRTDVHGKLTGQTYADRYMAALGAPAGEDATFPPAASKSPYALPATAKTDTQDKYGKAAAGALKGLAEMKAPVLGAGGNAPQLPSTAPMPMDAMPIASGGPGGGGQRADLATLMAALNRQTTVWG